MHDVNEGDLFTPMCVREKCLSHRGMRAFLNACRIYLYMRRARKQQ